MGDHVTKCIICNTTQTVDTYGNWTCIQCKQQYEYEKGYRIILTEHQIYMLGADK